MLLPYKVVMANIHYLFRKPTWSNLSSHSSHFSSHPVNVSPVFTLLIALYWSPPTPETNELLNAQLCSAASCKLGHKCVKKIKAMAAVADWNSHLCGLRVKLILNSTDCLNCIFFLPVLSVKLFFHYQLILLCQR